jgi:hypothetical protein
VGEFKYLPLSTIEKYETGMRKLGVSEVARSPRGFLAAYKRAGGNPNNLSEEWKRKRDGFIKRHMAQYRLNPTRRRMLALIAWAYMP